jgi:hypothetical protein
MLKRTGHWWNRKRLWYYDAPESKTTAERAYDTRRVFVSTGETLAIVFAGIAALASVWQGYLFRQTINTPYTANLQARQIETCAEFLFRARDAVETFRDWDQFKNTQFTSHGVDESKSIVDGLRNRARAAAGQVGPSVAKMSMLSRPATREIIARIDFDSGVMRELLESNGQSGETTSRLKEYDEDLNKLTNRCTDIMLGRQVGLF